MKLCSFKGCNKKHCARGLCNTHWAQQNRGYNLTPILTKETEEERFFRQIIKSSDPEGCWIFTGNGSGSGKGAKKGLGYGQLYHNGKKVMAHRYSYEYYIGPIPKGLQIDHLCRNTRCVNPKHLELLTQTENIKRKDLYHSLRKRIEILEKFIKNLGYNPITLKKEI